MSDEGVQMEPTDGTASEAGRPVVPPATLPLRRMARWVGLSVVLAAILTALATLIAIDSFDRVEDAMGDLNDLVVPALTSALRLSERAAALAAAAGELTSSETTDALDRNRAKQHGLAASALATLETLKPALPAGRHGPIVGAFEDLLLTLGELSDVVARGIALRARHERLTTELSKALERWNATNDALVRAARGGPPSDVASRDRASDVELALGIKADSNLFLASLKAALDQPDEDALLDTGLALRAAVRSIRDQAARLSVREIAARNPVPIDGLRRATEDAAMSAFGADGVLSLRRAELEAARKLAAIAAEARNRAIATQTLVGQAVGRIECDVEARRRAVAADIRLSKLQLITLSLGGMALAALVALLIYRAVARHETTLHQALVDVEGASRSKSEFLANMSHELRTPLNAIIGFAEILKTEVFGPLGAPQYRQYAGLIESSGDHLLNIITDILDISKIEAGKLELYPEPTDAAEVLDSVTRLIDLRARKGLVSLVVEVGPEVPTIHTDPIRLKQILLNLATNAVKFTNPGGTVTLSVDLVRPAEEASSGLPPDRVRFRVADTGIGMSAEGLRIAMRPFGQIDTPLNRNHGGTGLGLPLVANMVRLSGGEMTIDSAVGEGTTVAITLPLPPANQPPVAEIGRHDRPDTPETRTPAADTGRGDRAADGSASAVGA